MTICFVCDAWETLSPKSNSTLRMIHEAVRREHSVAILYPKNFTIRNNVVYGFIERIVPFEKFPTTIDAFHQKVQFKEQMLPLLGFDAIVLRADPPVNPTVLNFLDSVSQEVFVMNSVEGVRKGNNKLYTSTFHDPDNLFLPVTYVSKNKNYLKQMIMESPSEKMILKPLGGFGGSGVIVVEKSASASINSLLDFYIGSGAQKQYVILQEFVPGAEEGDVRILLLNGEPIGAMRRVPADDDIRSNVHAGGSAVKHTPTAKELEICKKIGPRLIKDGLYFVGIDIIGEKLIEVNVLSPGGIVNINRLNKTKLQERILDFIEYMAHDKNTTIQHRMACKEEVRNA